MLHHVLLANMCMQMPYCLKQQIQIYLTEVPGDAHCCTNIYEQIVAIIFHRYGSYNCMPFEQYT